DIMRAIIGAVAANGSECESGTVGHDMFPTLAASVVLLEVNRIPRVSSVEDIEAAGESRIDAIGSGEKAEATLAGPYTARTGDGFNESEFIVEIEDVKCAGGEDVK